MFALAAALARFRQLSVRVSTHHDKYEIRKKEIRPFARRARFPILADKSTPGQTAPARYHGNSRPLLFRRWQTLPARSLRNDGRLCRFLEIWWRFLLFDAERKSSARAMMSVTKMK